jgi:aminocarboxymuconate-semialdehyde decarboxylase
MPNRRHFLRTVAQATAGAYIAGGGFTAAAMQAPPARRQLNIGGRRVRVIDVHNHWDMPIPAEIVKGTPFEEYMKGATLDDRIPLLDKMGIDIAAVSVNDFWWWEAKDRGLARAICGYHNETLAKWNRMHPDRIVGMASVPLQFPDLAAEMLQEAVTKFGARGVTVGGHVNGESLSLPKFDPFWAKAAEMGQLVFMHPNGSGNLLKEGALAGRGGLGNIVGNPLETTVFLSRLIFDGTFDKFPALKVCGAHGGGYLPSYLGRTEVACQRANQNCIIKKKPSDYMRSQILADTMVFTEDGLRHLVAEMGAGQVVFGTDIPFGWPVNVDYVINHSTLSNTEKEQILGGNLMKLLRITS